ncbi:MAG: tRNA pseudouridine(55) synthase TruB [Pauljensenia sp.]|nr:tRNA pseudouridine(55) synthase TruB [Pauljensenia sp.]
MARRPDNPRPGLVVIDKPQGLTSHDVVARVRRLAHTRKVGHGGTLDPMATGVLVLGIGKATKLLTWVSGHSKEYRATIRFGISTNTDDAEGVATAAKGCACLSDADLEAAFAPLRGDIMQVPTTVSAIKVNGQRAYALARAGQDVELAARPVNISRLEVLAPPCEAQACVDEAGEGAACASGPVRVVDVDVAVECSSGTYVRALARDAGAALGVGAHLIALRRTRVGGFPLNDALTLDELTRAVEDTPTGEGEEPVLPLIPLGRAALDMFAALALTEAEAGAFAHGQAPRRSRAQLTQWAAEAGYAPPATAEEETPPIAAVSPSGEVLGLLRIDGTRLRTVLVF